MDIPEFKNAQYNGKRQLESKDGTMEVFDKSSASVCERFFCSATS